MFFKVREVLKSIQDTQIQADGEETIIIDLKENKKTESFFSFPLSDIVSMFLTEKANCQYFWGFARKAYGP